jgi:putative oxidoreductase
MNALTTPAALAGRLLLGGFFLYFGLTKFASLGGTAGYIASVGLPMPMAAAVFAAGLETFGGLALLLGFQARIAALALALFTLVATVIFHAFWAVPAEQAFMQQLMFTKNLALTGGLFMLVALGAGPLSLDNRRTATA